MVMGRRFGEALQHKIISNLLLIKRHGYKIKRPTGGSVRMGVCVCMCACTGVRGCGGAQQLDLWLQLLIFHI